MGRVHRLTAAVATLGALGLVGLVAACGGKKDDAGGPGAGEARAVAQPVSCPPGNAVKDGACVAVVTAEKIAAVARLQSRLDDLARLLDQVDTVGAPIELFDGIRQLEPWQKLKASSSKLAAVDAVGDALNRAVKMLRAFKGNLGQTSARLANLKGELDRAMADTGAPRRIEELRAQVSAQVRAAVEPFAAEVEDTIRNALAPLGAQLSELSDMVITGCTMATLSGGGDKMKDRCARARDTFGKAVVYVDDLKGRPAKLFTDLTSQLETELGPLIDAETRKLVDAAQVKVNQALRLPPAGSASPAAGSATGSGTSP